MGKERNDGVRHALLILTFPAVLTLGIVLIPVVQDYANHASAGEAVRDSTRWLIGHLLSAVAFGLGILASFIVFFEAGARRGGLGLMGPTASAIGGGLYAAGLGADGIGPLAALYSTGRPDNFFAGSGELVPIVFMMGTLFWGVGLFSQLAAAHRAGMLRGPAAWVTGAAALCFVGAPAIPSGWALYLVALSAWGIYLPLIRGVLRAGRSLEGPPDARGSRQHRP